jgi:hypothetical protein
LSNISYHLVRDNGGTGVDTVTAFDPNSTTPIVQADSRHPHWHNILEGLADNDPTVFELFDIKKGLKTRLKRLSDRVSFDGDDVLFDGDPQAGPLADHLKRCMEAGTQDYKPVVAFWEKVATNPDKRSREQLFKWLQSHEFTITENGDILGYKGVVGKTESEFRSSHAGTAYVDGVKKTGQIPNKPGTVVTMPRSKVANDPNVACHYGLHVGDWSYASTFVSGGAVLEVHVNPRDVVSIPNDHSSKKMRCCRYEVVKVRDKQTKAPIATTDDDEWYGDVGYEVD